MNIRNILARMPLAFVGLLIIVSIRMAIQGPLGLDPLFESRTEAVEQTEVVEEEHSPNVAYDFDELNGVTLMSVQNAKLGEVGNPLYSSCTATPLSNDDKLTVLGRSEAGLLVSHTFVMDQESQIITGTTLPPSGAPTFTEIGYREALYIPINDTKSFIQVSNCGDEIVVSQIGN